MFFFLLASGLSIMVIVQAITAKHNTNPTDVKSAEKKTVQGTQLTGFTPTSDVKALKITDTKAGNGQAAKAGDKVTVLYTGAVASTGTIFQSTTDTGQPASLDLNSVIKGWQDGIPGMKVGGTRRLLIPADQAYGANPPSGSGIPANAPLVFDITLLKVGS
jgi:FKBP-type peptidyl-prolyl cis-trans isomerase